MAKQPIELVLKEHADRLMALPGVVGIGQGRRHGKPCIQVFVNGKPSGLLTRIPTSIEGYPVAVVESGEFRALAL